MACRFVSIDSCGSGNPVAISKFGQILQARITQNFIGSKPSREPCPNTSTPDIIGNKKSVPKNQDAFRLSKSDRANLSDL